jgi:hydrogenase maturation protease
LVQELMDGYEALIIVDAVDRDGEPGTLYLLETEVPALDDLSDESRAAFMTDMHYTVPSKALILGKALDVLPPRIYFLGCQPGEYGLGMSLSQPVEAAVERAIEQIVELARNLAEGSVHVPGYSA